MRKKAMQKKSFPRKKTPNKTLLIKAMDEKGKTVYSGKERRKHEETVLFDSRAGQRRFIPGPGGISPRRRKQLSDEGPAKIVLGKKTYISKRNSKHRERKL